MLREITSIWPVLIGTASAVIIIQIKPVDRWLKKLFRIEKVTCPICGEKTLDPEVMIGRSSILDQKTCENCGTPYKANGIRKTLCLYASVVWFIAFSFTPGWVWGIACFLEVLGMQYGRLKLFKPEMLSRQ